MLQRHPVLEVRVGLEGVGPVVEELVLLDARGDHQVLVAMLGERAIRLRPDDGEVVSV
jgi:hypothetical protein